MRLGQAAKLATGKTWLTERYYDYLQHRDLEAERDAIHRIMTRPARIRTNTWSASSSGGCGRARQFAFLGMPKKRIDEKTGNIFMNGDYVHLRHQAVGLVAGYLVAVEVAVEETSLSLTGTIDALTSHGALAEFKSINSYGFGNVMSFGVKQDHLKQMNAYFYAAGLERGHAVYENKDTNVIAEFIIQRDEHLIEEIVTELRELNEATAEKRLLPMLPECRKMQGMYNWCPFAPICDDAEWPKGQ